MRLSKVPLSKAPAVIHVPVLAGQVESRHFSIRLPVDIRIDTGADISVIPEGYMRSLNYSRVHEVDSFHWRQSANSRVLKPVYEVNFILGNGYPTISQARVIELD